MFIRVQYILLWLQEILVDPGCYRELNDLLQRELRGQGQIEVLNLKEIEEGDETF